MTSPARTPVPEDAVPRSAAGSALSRLQRELTELMKSSPDGIYAFPEGSDLFRWVATMRGPVGSVYDGLEFKLSIAFPPDYPFHPPAVFFVTPCFHPNVSLRRGDVCLDILREQWSAVLTIGAVLLSLRSLLASPNNESPLNVEAAVLWGREGDFRDKVMMHLNGGEVPSSTSAAAI